MTPHRGNIIGERVRMARLSAKPAVTQEQLAARLQVAGFDYIDQAKISRIESGERPVQDYELLTRSTVVGVLSDWLLNEVKPVGRKRTQQLSTHHHYRTVGR